MKIRIIYSFSISCLLLLSIPLSYQNETTSNTPFGKDSIRSKKFQLFYNKNIIKMNSSMEFHIPFDLHGADCGAPDCYTTHLKFITSPTTTDSLPSQLTITIQEKGCSIKDTSTHERLFILEKDSDSLTAYISPETGAGLIMLWKEPKAYYLPKCNANQLTKSALDKLLNSEQETSMDGYPYQSAIFN